MTIIFVIFFISFMFMFLLSFILSFRYYNKKDRVNNGFMTCQGVRVKPSPKTAWLTQKIMEELLDNLIQTWYLKKGWEPKLIRQAMNGTSIIMFDQHYLVVPWDNEIGEMKVNGVAYPSTGSILISTLPRPGSTDTIKHKTKSLILHEESHFIGGHVGGIWTNEAAHELFEEINLGV